MSYEEIIEYQKEGLMGGAGPSEIPDHLRELAQKYNGIYLEVSALDGTNIDEIFSMLALEIYHNKMKRNKKLKEKNQILVNNDKENLKDEKKKKCCK